MSALVDGDATGGSGGGSGGIDSGDPVRDPGLPTADDIVTLETFVLAILVSYAGVALIAGGIDSLRESYESCHRTPRRVLAFLYMRTAVGSVIDVAQGLLSLASCVLFVVSTYEPLDEPPPQWMVIADVCFLVLFTADCESLPGARA